MTQSNCNTCDHKPYAPTPDGHCYMFKEEPDVSVCGYHSGLSINDKGLCNLAYWMAQMDVDEDNPESVEPVFEEVQNWLIRFTKPNWSGGQLEAVKLKQRLGLND